MSKTHDEPRRKRTRIRWLYAAAIGAVVIGAVVVYLLPIWRERAAMLELRSAGYAVETEPRRPAWLWRHMGAEWQTPVGFSDYGTASFHSCGVGGSGGGGSYVSVDSEWAFEVMLHSFEPSNVSELFGRGDSDPTDLQTVSTLKNLRTLSWKSKKIADEDLRCLNNLAGLEEVLILSEETCEPRALLPIAELKNLHTLYLSGVEMNRTSAEVLGGLPRLKKLGMAEITTGADGLAPLMSQLDLQELGLHHVHLRREDIIEIAKMPTLTSLRLNGTNLDDEMLHELGNCRRLESLSAINTQVTARGVAELQRRLPACLVRGFFDVDVTTVESPDEP